MNELVKWLKENVGDSIEIVTPQFERTEELAFEYKPRTKEEFESIITKAPWEVLKGLGFRKWDSMNNIIKDNMRSPVSKVIKIPIINSSDEYCVDIGRGSHPTALLEVDEDVILIPGEWYDIIPDGFLVTGLYGEQYPFKRGESDDDIRCGCLPYGIRRKLC